MERPVTYSQRTGHQLSTEHNMLQAHLNDFNEFTNKNQFKINHKKSFILKFNFSNKYDFEPEFFLDGNRLEYVKQMKILGIQIDESLKWNSHVNYICNKARKRIWMIRRMTQIHLDYETILNFYFKEIRSLLEYGVVVFNGALTKKQIASIENIQRNILYMLAKYLNLNMSYNEATIFFCTEPLFSRRADICRTFIKRNLKNPRFQNLFVNNIHKYNVRNKTKKFKEFKPRMKRFETSLWFT